MYIPVTFDISSCKWFTVYTEEVMSLYYYTCWKQIFTSAYTNVYYTLYIYRKPTLTLHNVYSKCYLCLQYTV